MEVLKDYPKEFSKLFRPSFNLLRHINMRFLAEDKGLIRNHWRSFIILSCMALNGFILTWSLVSMISMGKIFEIAYLLPTVLVTVQGILKISILIYNTSLISTIIAELGSLWRTTGLDLTQRNARDSLIKRMNIFNRSTYWACLAATVMYLISPLIETMVRCLVLRQACDQLLPLLYPFQVRGWAAYLALYAFQLYSMSLSVCAYMGTELIMNTLCAALALDFTLLCEDVRRAAPPLDSSPAEAGESDSPNWTLGDIVERHQTLCILANKLDAAFNQIVFIDLKFVGLTIVFFRYAAQFARGPTYSINNYIGLCSALLKVLYLCHSGDLLMRASLRVGDMAYHSAWFRGDKKHRTTIIILILRSQTACCMTSMKYSPVTLDMFTKVMSTTWSFLSVMNAVYGDD